MEPSKRNYRVYYKRYYGIEFEEGYIVHHIDGDRDNNDIGNLIMLPRSLHLRYHDWVKNHIDKESGKMRIHHELNSASSMYREWENSELREYLSIIEECQKWVMLKELRYRDPEGNITPEFLGYKGHKKAPTAGTADA